MVETKNSYIATSDVGAATLTNALRVFRIAMRHRFRLDAARPSIILQRDGKVVNWTDEYVDGLKSALFACNAL